MRNESTYITNETHVKQMREANTIFKTRGEANFECMYCNSIYDLRHVVCRVKYKNKWGDWKFAGYYVAIENDEHIKEVVE